MTEISAEPSSIATQTGSARAAIALDAVGKRYGRQEVLSGLSLDVDVGECFALVGTNGAGKTTCLKGMLDFQQVDAGTIEIFGVPHTRTEARARLAFLPERFSPPYYLTGAEFLERDRHGRPRFDGTNLGLALSRDGFTWEVRPEPCMDPFRPAR